MPISIIVTVVTHSWCSITIVLIIYRECEHCGLFWIYYNVQIIIVITYLKYHVNFNGRTKGVEIHGVWEGLVRVLYSIADYFDYYAVLCKCFFFLSCD